MGVELNIPRPGIYKEYLKDIKSSDLLVLLILLTLFWAVKG
jgi:hypothetical protein